MLHQENRLKSSQPLKKRVEWHSDSMNPRRTVARQQRWVLEGICELIRTAAQVNSLRLNLLIDNDILYYLTASPSLERDSVQRFVSLGVFLGGHSRSQKNPVTRTGRLILMVVLANAFLHLCEGPWISEDLTKSNIYLSLINDRASPNLARLYLSTQCISLKDRKCHQKVDGTCIPKFVNSRLASWYFEGFVTPHEDSKALEPSSLRQFSGVIIFCRM